MTNSISPSMEGFIDSTYEEQLKIMTVNDNCLFNDLTLSAANYPLSIQWTGYLLAAQWGNRLFMQGNVMEISEGKNE